MRKIADEYQKRNPNVKVDVEVGGATSDAQQQYLSTVLSSKDSVLDLILIDVTLALDKFHLFDPETGAAIRGATW